MSVEELEKRYNVRCDIPGCCGAAEAVTKGELERLGWAEVGAVTMSQVCGGKCLYQRNGMALCPRHKARLVELLEGDDATT